MFYNIFLTQKTCMDKKLALPLQCKNKKRLF